MKMELNRFEKARIIGARALQLASGAPPLLEVKEGLSAYAISLAELQGGIIPLAVLR